MVSVMATPDVGEKYSVDSTTDRRSADVRSPILVLLPGLDGTGKLFAEFLKVIESRIDTLVVAYPSDTPMSYDELERLVLASLPADRPFVLLGESFSGPLAIRIAALLAVDEISSLPKISVPALVLCATRDRVVSEAATRKIMRGIAHAQLVDIEGPHLLLQTCAAPCAAAVLSFMRQCSSQFATDLPG
jgi:pimeloyl-ACP methyl ester carboxylesterase